MTTTQQDTATATRTPGVHVITLAGDIAIEAHVHIGNGGYAMPGAQSIGAWGMAFNDDADVIAETDTHQYVDYCESEILYHELHRLFAGQYGIESETIGYAVDETGLSCDCE